MAGVEFIDEKGGGPRLRLRKQPKNGPWPKCHPTNHSRNWWSS